MSSCQKNQPFCPSSLLQPLKVIHNHNYNHHHPLLLWATLMRSKLTTCNCITPYKKERRMKHIILYLMNPTSLPFLHPLSLQTKLMVPIIPPILPHSPSFSELEQQQNSPSLTRPSSNHHGSGMPPHTTPHHHTAIYQHHMHYAAPRSTTQLYVALRSTTQHSEAPHSTMQHYAASRSITQHHAASRSITQHHAASRSTIRYHAVPHINW